MKTREQQTVDEAMRLKGEYLGLMASIEYHLTLVIIEYLGVTSHSAEFEDWLVSAPIPFNHKIDLFERFVKEDTQLQQFQALLRSLRSLWRFRNMLAHSFGTPLGTRTSDGKDVPAHPVTLKALRSRIGESTKVEDLLTYIVVCAQEGPPGPISADDYADAPV